MKHIVFDIIKNEGTPNERVGTFKISIDDKIFNFLSINHSYINQSKYVSKDIITKVDVVMDKVNNLHYEVIYNILENVAGIGQKEIGDLGFEINGDYITAQVYLWGE